MDSPRHGVHQELVALARPQDLAADSPRRAYRARRPVGAILDRATANNTAVFLDRDGVLNELVLRDGMAVSPRRVEDFRLSDGAMQAVQRLRQVGLLVFVVSNQPDIARGQLTQEDMSQMSRILEDVVGITEFVDCPHEDTEGSGCGK